MATRYQAMVAAKEQPYLLPVYQEHTYRLATDLRDKNKRFTQDSPVVDILLLERIVQAAAAMGARVDADIQQTLLQDFGVGGLRGGAIRVRRRLVWGAAC